MTLKTGLKANVDFIFGLPGETKEDIESTVKVISDLVKLGARIHAHAFMPLVQTPFAGKSAGRVGKSIQRIIKKLLPEGIIYGNWKEQEKNAKKISWYLKNGGFAS